jgi:thiosulfate/3-mercaptopyruvate sulfurtransferase
MPKPTLPLIVEPAQLNEHLNDANLLILDVRNIDSYAEGHIPRAINLNYANIIHIDPPAMGLLPDEDYLSIIFSGIGLTPDHHIVAYDDEGGGRASRLLWTLDTLGQEGLSLLNGGIQLWTAEERPLDQQTSMATPSRYEGHFLKPEISAGKDYILSRLGQDDLALLDTRSPAEYAGIDVRAARGGHIPGAVNMNWTDAMDFSHHLRLQPDDTLRAMLEHIGVTPDKEVIVYCQTHHRSAHTYMVLKHLGYPRLRGYPGAWSEWGNDPDLPVEQG